MTLRIQAPRDGELDESYQAAVVRGPSTEGPAEARRVALLESSGSRSYGDQLAQAFEG